MLEQLGGGWQAVAGHHLQREYQFRDFREALAFTNRVGAVAEEEGHHPDLQLSWGRVVVQIWTHAADGLTESDFILAARIDVLAATDNPAEPGQWPGWVGGSGVL